MLRTTCLTIFSLMRSITKTELEEGGNNNQIMFIPIYIYIYIYIHIYIFQKNCFNFVDFRNFIKLEKKSKFLYYHCGRSFQIFLHYIHTHTHTHTHTYIYIYIYIMKMFYYHHMNVSYSDVYTQMYLTINVITISLSMVYHDRVIIPFDRNKNLPIKKKHFDSLSTNNFV